MKRLAAACLALALAGCAALPFTAEGIMSDALQAARAPAAEQAAAVERAQREFRSAPSALHRVRLATLLAVLPAPLRDDARALELLAPVAEPGAPGVGGFAAFLAAQVGERQRLAREAERQAREAERLARERAAAERERQAAEKERDKREEALRQQLEALRAIERGILEREERMRKKPGGKP